MSITARTSLIAAALGLLGLLGCKREDPAPAREQGAKSRAQVEATDDGDDAAEVCGRIAFVEGDAEAGSRVGLVSARGGEVEALMPTPVDPEGSSFPAAVSPDGRTLLVLSSREREDGRTRDRFALVELGSPPSEPRPIDLEPGEQLLRNPAWAPDGSWLVYESDAHGFRDLYRLELGSGSVLRLTDNPEGNFEPAVSPEGQRIAFVSSRDGDAEIYLMTADGGSPQRLTSSPGDDTAPRWSPDGRLVAFRSARERARGIDVFVMNADGSEPRPLIPEPRAEQVIVHDLAFSPDGTRLAFSEQLPSRKTTAVVIVELDEGAVVARIAGPGVTEHPSWSPDGRHLVVTRTVDGRSKVARVRADGGGLEPLTTGEEARWLPRWIAEPGCPRVAPAVLVEPPSGQG